MTYTGISAETLKEWRTGAWYANRTDTLAEIHAEFVKRGGCDTVTCVHPVCQSNR